MLLVWLGPYATTMRARATFLTRACGDEATPSAWETARAATNWVPGRAKVRLAVTVTR